MLYDKKWDFKTKADPLSIEALISWLEKQPADCKYNFVNPETCLLAQYFTFSAGSAHLSYQAGPVNHLRDFYEIAKGDGKPADFTFGAALNRARKFAAR